MTDRAEGAVAEDRRQPIELGVGRLRRGNRHHQHEHPAPIGRLVAPLERIGHVPPDESRDPLDVLPDELASAADQRETALARRRLTVGGIRIDMDSTPEIGPFAGPPVEPFLERVDPLSAAAVGLPGKPRVVEFVAPLPQRQDGLVLVAGFEHLSPRGIAAVLARQTIGLEFILDREEPGPGHHAGKILDQVAPFMGQHEHRSVVTDVPPEILKEDRVVVDAAGAAAVHGVVLPVGAGRPGRVALDRGRGQVAEPQRPEPVPADVQLAGVHQLGERGPVALGRLRFGQSRRSDQQTDHHQGRDRRPGPNQRGPDRRDPAEQEGPDRLVGGLLCLPFEERQLDLTIVNRRQVEASGDLAPHQQRQVAQLPPPETLEQRQLGRGHGARRHFVHQLGVDDPPFGPKAEQTDRDHRGHRDDHRKPGAGDAGLSAEGVAVGQDPEQTIRADRGGQPDQRERHPGDATPAVDRRTEAQPH